MKLKHIILFAAALVMLAGCGSDRQRRVDTIRANEKVLYSDSVHSINHQLAQQQVDACREFAEKYPGDSLAPEFLFQGAEVAVALGQGKEAITMLENLRKEYPQHAKAATALFMIAFFYETALHDNAKAEAGYSEFLRQYPDHQLAKSAEFSLMQLKQGMSPEDIVKMFEARGDTAKTSQAQ